MASESNFGILIYFIALKSSPQVDMKTVTKCISKHCGISWHYRQHVSQPSYVTSKKPKFEPGRIIKIVTKTLNAIDKGDHLELNICRADDICPEEMWNNLPVFINSYYYTYWF